MAYVSDFCSRSLAARGTPMPWIFVGLIYIINITSADAVHLVDQNFSDMNTEEAAIAVKNMLQEKPNIPPGKELQYKKDWEKLKQEMEQVRSSAKKTVRGLRALADRLDQAWWEYKVRCIFAGLSCIIGGVTAHMTDSVTKSATVMGFGLAGAIITFKAYSIKDAKDFEENKLAEKLLNETEKKYTAMKEKLNEWSIAQEYLRLIYIYQLSEASEVASPLVLNTLLGCIFDSLRIPSERVRQAVTNLVNLGWRTAGKSLSKLLASLKTALLIVDAIDLGFNIRDIAKKKGSDAAKDLREIAQQIEAENGINS